MTKRKLTAAERKQLVVLTRGAMRQKTRADCTVRALALSAEIAYELAEQIAGEGGRSAGRRIKSIKVITAAKKRGLRFRKLRFAGKTLGKFIRLHPVGRFYISKRGHALAVVDGVRMDGTPLGAIVLAAWQAQ